MKHLQIIAITLIFLLLSACSGSESTKILFTGSNIIDIESGQVSEGQSILIEDGVISSVFSDGSQNISGIETVSMDGKYVIPGLWDMHIHLRGGDELINSNRELLPLFIANGVTTIRDAGGDLTSSIYDWRIEIESNMLTGPYIYTSGPKIDGVDPTWEGSIEITNSEEISAALDSLQDLEVDYIKIYESRLSGENYLEIIRQTEERGLTVTGHMPMDILIEDAIEAGLDGIEHLYYVMKGTSSREAEITEMVQNGEIGFWQAVAELKDSYNEDLARDFYQILAENEVYVVPTLHIDDILSYLHEEDHSEEEFLSYIPDDLEATYQRRLRSAQNRSESAIQFEEELNDLFKRMTNDMQEAGVKILAGSDAGAYNSFVYPGISLHKELEQMVNSGLTPLEALQTSILNGAAFFNDFDKVGSIAAGKKADLLFLDANPLEDITNTQNINTVVSDGRVFNNQDLQNLYTDSDL